MLLTLPRIPTICQDALNIDIQVSSLVPNRNHLPSYVYLSSDRAESMWSFLKPSAKIVHGLSRSALLTQMTKDRDLARFVLGLLSQAVASSTVHRTLINFHTSVAIEYTSRVPVPDEGILAFFLPSITGPMGNDAANREITVSQIISCLLRGLED